MKAVPTKLSAQFTGIPQYERRSNGATVIAISNLKGGVGKTTTAVNLAAALAVRYRVLLVDLDSQASATLSLGLDRKQQTPSILDVMLNYAPFGRAVKLTNIQGLNLVPANVDLAKFDAYVSNARNHIYLLQKVLEGIKQNYDFILLDCPPSLSLITLNAFIASDCYITPVTPHGLAFEAMRTLFRELEVWEKKFRIKTTRLGILMTMVDLRSNYAKKIWDQVSKLYDGDLFESQIKMNIKVAEAPDVGQSVMEFDAGSQGARAYWTFAKEVVQRINLMHQMADQEAKSMIPASDRAAFSTGTTLVNRGISEFRRETDYTPMAAFRNF